MRRSHRLAAASEMAARRTKIPIFEYSFRLFLMRRRLANMRTDAITARKSRERGITLLELMVALTLFGLIAVLVSSATRLSLDASSRGEAKAQSIRTDQTVHSLLRNQVQGALPLRYWTEADDKRVEHLGFEGESNRLRFVSRDGLTDGPNSLPRWVDLRSSETANSSGKLLVEEHRILSRDNLPGETAIARAELSNCTEPRFEYLDATGERPAWLSAWNGLERRAPLPAAVRLRCKAASNPVQLLIPLDYADQARQGMRLQ
jgi:prepilin-type N-terminal cleavage/methylation domain-containing protein